MIGPWQLGTSRRHVPFGDSYAHVDVEESKTRCTRQNMFKENSEWLPKWLNGCNRSHSSKGWVELWRKYRPFIGYNKIYKRQVAAQFKGFQIFDTKMLPKFYMRSWQVREFLVPLISFLYIDLCKWWRLLICRFPYRVRPRMWRHSSTNQGQDEGTDLVFCVMFLVLII